MPQPLPFSQAGRSEARVPSPSSRAEGHTLGDTKLCLQFLIQDLGTLRIVEIHKYSAWGRWVWERQEEEAAEEGLEIGQRLTAPGLAGHRGTSTDPPAACQGAHKAEGKPW